MLDDALDFKVCDKVARTKILWVLMVAIIARLRRNWCLKYVFVGHNFVLPSKIAARQECTAILFLYSRWESENNPPRPFKCEAIFTASITVVENLGGTTISSIARAVH